MNHPTVSDIRPSRQAPPEGFQCDTPHPGHPADPPAPRTGDKAKARDLLAAIRILTCIEQERRPPTPPERQALALFPGFGPLALRLFPDPVTGHYRDATWQQLGEALRALLTPEDYASARRTTFTAFYTSPLVIRAMYQALARLGVPPEATVLEPGCGCGHFIGEAPPGMRFIGIEIDSLSGRIAQALYPTHDIRIENFRDTTLPEDRIDAVIGNVPFADITYTYHGQRLALHDFFLAKALDALKPGGVLALVTSHYTLDKLNGAHREFLAERADFLGAIRLPSEAFKQAGTQVVTDIVFLHKRSPGDARQHVDDAWLHTEPLRIDGAPIPINAYFLHHPEMVLGAWSRQDRLYGSDATYSLRTHGDLAAQLHAAVARLPEGVYSARASADPATTRRPRPPLADPLTEGSFFVAEDQTIMQVQGGEAVTVTHGDRPV
jgi:SAM-dependent methyltransferase